jgi:hypothetical protein
VVLPKPLIRLQATGFARPTQQAKNVADRQARIAKLLHPGEKTTSMLTRKTLLLAIVPVAASWATSAAIAQTAGMNRRQDRRGDRQDCRQQEGLVGADKRNCKQQGRQTR